MKNDPKNIQEIQNKMVIWDSALKDKDFDTLVQNYAPDFLCFDIKETARGPEGYKNLWAQCADYFHTIEVHRKDVNIQTDGSMGLVTFLTRVKGMKETPDSDMARSWFRGTVVLRKDDKGEWQVLHEHVSCPVDCMSEKAAFILEG